MAEFQTQVEGFVFTTAIRKLRMLKKRIKGVPGGTSAGKTYGILPILIDRAIKKPNTDISVVSESVPQLRKGALKDFLNIMKATGRYIDEHYNRTLLTYTFSNGSYIEFFSADQEQRVRGPRRKILYINECNNVSFETYHQLAIRTSDEIWLDFNPSEEFWYHSEIRPDPDTDELVLTYKDNEALAPALVHEIEKSKEKAYFNSMLEPPALFANENIKNYYWHNWWKVYGLGLVGSLDGVIFTNWKQVDEIPREAKLIGYCIDFGYTNDPTTLLAAYEWEGKVIWDELLYMKGLTNPEIAAKMKEFGIKMGDFIVADSAEPKSIDEINTYGFNIRKSEKGRDSVNFGIDVLQKDNFFVTKRSTNLIKELRSYMWAKDKTGKSLNKPIDAYNHCIDPMRYLAVAKLSKWKNIKKRGVRRRN